MLTHFLCVYVCVWRRSPQQMLRTHRSFDAYCATLWWALLVFFPFFEAIEHQWNEIDRGKPKYSERNLTATLSTTNPTWTTHTDRPSRPGQAMLQAVGRRFLVSEARVSSQAMQRGILWWTDCHCDWFFSEYFEALLPVQFQECSVLFVYSLFYLFTESHYIFSMLCLLH